MADVRDDQPNEHERDDASPPSSPAAPQHAPQGQQQRPEAADRPEGSLAPGKVLPPAARGLRSPKASRRVIEQRVAFIQRAMNDQGLTRAHIFALVSTAQLDEKKKRNQARFAGASAAEAAELAPVIWGDEPIPERTIEFYIGKAKQKTAEEGRLLTRDKTFLISQQMLRLNDLYRRAITKGSLQVALNVLREIADTFGMRDAVKVMLIALAGEAEGQEKASKRGFDLTTDEGRARALSALMGRAITTDPELANVISRFTVTALPSGALVSAGDAELHDSNDVTPATPKKTTNGNGSGTHANGKPHNGASGNV